MDWMPLPIPDFGERVTYDPNGNILKYKRNGNETWAGKPLRMDSLTYHCEAGKKRPNFISDSVGVDNYDEDIDAQLANN
jgi:hypothetical protein